MSLPLAPPSRTFIAGPEVSIRSVNQMPTEILDYTCSIDPSENDTVSAATWAITPSGPTISAATNSGPNSTIQLSVLTLGTKYTLSCQITGVSTQVFDGVLQVVAVAAHL